MPAGECEETHSGPWHVNYNNLHQSSQDLKLSKRLARWVPNLTDKEMKKERVSVNGNCGDDRRGFSTILDF